MPAVSTSGFPSKGSNRTRAQAIAEICDYVGGGDRPDVQQRAGRSWDAAVRSFNDVLWAFNRLSADISFNTTTATETYSLENDCYGVYRVVLVDSDSKVRQSVDYVKYEELLTYNPDTVANSSVPEVYALRNRHEDGLISFRPVPSTSATWPTATVHYFRLIGLATGNDDQLNVPLDVDQAILDEAVFKFISKSRSFAEARDAKAVAVNSRLEVEQRHRDFTDIANLRSLE